jgi:hypothetical protein
MILVVDVSFYRNIYHNSYRHYWYGIGVIAGRPAIKGSCGGLNQIGLSGSCSGACSATEKEECAKRKHNNNN